MDSSIGSQPTRTLDGCRVLVVEDEFFLADDLDEELKRRGAKVVGPVAELGAAKDHISHDGFDVAVIDLNLHGELGWEIVDELVARKIPFGFFTGYGEGAIPERFRLVTKWEKPCDVSKIAHDIQLLCPNRK